MTKEITINEIQVDIIYKALYFVARSVELVIPAECIDVFEVLAEQNSNDTHAEHTVDVMQSLVSFLKQCDTYQSHFDEED